MGRNSDVCCTVIPPTSERVRCWPAGCCEDVWIKLAVHAGSRTATVFAYMAIGQARSGGYARKVSVHSDHAYSHHACNCKHAHEHGVLHMLCAARGLQQATRGVQQLLGERRQQRGGAWPASTYAVHRQKRHRNGRILHLVGRERKHNRETGPAVRRAGGLHGSERCTQGY